MSKTEERLTDAFAAAARTIPEETLRPLLVPPRRRRPAWLTPVAAVLGIVLVVGLAFAAGTRLTGSRSSGPAGSQAPVPRYYVTEGLQGGAPVVRSRATGKITGIVPVPKSANAGVDDLVASSRSGTFFVMAAAPGTQGQRLYLFRLTSTGRVTGFAAVPGGTMGTRDWTADAIAASPDGSRVAVSFEYNWSAPGCTSGGVPCQPGTHPDYIDVITVSSGARSVWRGGTDPAFSVASLSWTAHGRQLVYLGQTCRSFFQRSRGFQLNSEVCRRVGRTAEVRALNPAAGGGRLDSGAVLLRQSARYPYLAQAQISPDGATITVIVLTGRMTSTNQVFDLVPPHLSVIQVSRSSGAPLRVLYQRNLGRTADINQGPDFLQLSQDGAGQHWLLSGGLSCTGQCTAGFNGWLRDGGLKPLAPVAGQELNETW